MRVAIDREGRLVIPKALREKLHLEAGTVLEVRARDGRLELEPAPAPMKLERRGFPLIATTDVPLPRLSADQARTAIEAQRQ